MMLIISLLCQQCLPEARGAMLGKLGHFLEKSGKCEVWDKVASEGARTVPGRENGGNCDIKNLSRGCTVYFPVFVPGALLSMGDMHMSQGDGEVSFCGAIEMAGFLDLRCTVIKGENSNPYYFRPHTTLGNIPVGS